MQLTDLALRPKSGQANRRLASGREHERQSIGPSCYELANDVAHVGRVVDQVEVVEDERCGFARHSAKLAEERVEHRVE